MSDVVPVGKCPVHGLVHGDDVDINFPVNAECQCGRELDRATYTSPEKLEEIEGSG